MIEYVERERREDIDFVEVEAALALFVVGACYACGSVVNRGDEFVPSFRPIHQQCIVPFITSLEAQLAAQRVAQQQRQQYPGYPDNNILITYPYVGTSVQTNYPFIVTSTTSATTTALTLPTATLVNSQGKVVLSPGEKSSAYFNVVIE